MDINSPMLKSNWLNYLHLMMLTFLDTGHNYPRRARSASAWILFSLWMYVCMFVCMLPL